MIPYTNDSDRPTEIAFSETIDLTNDYPSFSIICSRTCVKRYTSRSTAWMNRDMTWKAKLSKPTRRYHWHFTTYTTSQKASHWTNRLIQCDLLGRRYSVSVSCSFSNTDALVWLAPACFCATGTLRMANVWGRHAVSSLLAVWMSSLVTTAVEWFLICFTCNICA